MQTTGERELMSETCHDEIIRLAQTVLQRKIVLFRPQSETDLLLPNTNFLRVATNSGPYYSLLSLLKAEL